MTRAACPPGADRAAQAQAGTKIAARAPRSCMLDALATEISGAEASEANRHLPPEARRRDAGVPTFSLTSLQALRQ